MGGCMGRAAACFGADSRRTDQEPLFDEEQLRVGPRGPKSVSSYLSRKRIKARRRAEQLELAETRRAITEGDDVTQPPEMTSHIMDPARLAQEVGSARPRCSEDGGGGGGGGSRMGWRLGGLWSRLNRSATSVASSGSLFQTGSQWGSCDLEWDTEGGGFSPRRPGRRPTDDEQMSCGRTIDTCSAARSRDDSPTSLDWDADYDPLEPPTGRPPPPPGARMTDSDLTNGNFADVGDDETEQLIGEIEAMTRRTLAETGAVIGFIDDA